MITSAVGCLKVCLKYAGFTFTHSSCGNGTFFMAGVPTINSTSHNKVPCCLVTIAQVLGHPLPELEVVGLKPRLR